MTDALAGLPVWLINLERAADRRARMSEQLERLGLAYTLFPGVDGKAERERLLQSVDVPAFERNTGRRVLPGDMGCHHSRIGVWRAFLDSGAPVALILEDDVVFHDDFREALAVALRAQEHWDLLKLNRIRAKLPVSQGRLGAYALNAYVGPCTGNGAYLIKEAAARRILPGMLPMTRATDHEINRYFVHDFRLRGLEPFPSHVDDGNVSQITGTGFADVRKLSPLERLPYYRLKTANYVRRIWWMLRKGELWPKGRQLPGRAQ